MIIYIHVHCKISSIEYIKTCLIRHLFNPVPHVIRHFMPTLTVFYVCYTCLSGTLSIPTRNSHSACRIRQVLMYFYGNFTTFFSSLKNTRHAQLEMKS